MNGWSPNLEWEVGRPRDNVLGPVLRRPRVNGAKRVVKAISGTMQSSGGGRARPVTAVAAKQARAERKRGFGASIFVELRLK